MFDHVTIPVSDLTRSLTFYDQALKPLGLSRLYTDPGWTFAGYGIDRPSFWLGLAESVQTPTHVAFTAADRATVDRFHAAALAVGGRDNGQPGLRPHYHADYYGAFILDPDGHNIEAVNRGPG